MQRPVTAVSQLFITHSSLTAQGVPMIPFAVQSPAVPPAPPTPPQKWVESQSACAVQVPMLQTFPVESHE